MNPKLTTVGMEYCKHKTYGGSLVIVYASDVTSEEVSTPITFTMPNG
jgi:hypothetical protein